MAALINASRELYEEITRSENKDKNKLSTEIIENVYHQKFEDTEIPEVSIFKMTTETKLTNKISTKNYLTFGYLKAIAADDIEKMHTLSNDAIRDNDKIPTKGKGIKKMMQGAIEITHLNFYDDDGYDILSHKFYSKKHSNYIKKNHTKKISAGDIEKSFSNNFKIIDDADGEPINKYISLIEYLEEKDKPLMLCIEKIKKEFPHMKNMIIMKIDCQDFHKYNIDIMREIFESKYYWHLTNGKLKINMGEFVYYGENKNWENIEYPPLKPRDTMYLDHAKYLIEFNVYKVQKPIVSGDSKWRVKIGNKIFRLGSQSKLMLVQANNISLPIINIKRYYVKSELIGKGNQGNIFQILDNIILNLQPLLYSTVFSNHTKGNRERDLGKNMFIVAKILDKKRVEIKANKSDTNIFEDKDLTAIVAQVLKEQTVFYGLRSKTKSIKEGIVIDYANITSDTPDKMDYKEEFVEYLQNRHENIKEGYKKQRKKVPKNKPSVVNEDNEIVKSKEIPRKNFSSGIEGIVFKEQGYACANKPGVTYKELGILRQGVMIECPHWARGGDGKIHKPIYDIDHRDNNRSNCSKENCQILCKCCHAMKTFINKSTNSYQPIETE